mmetsp:Transcript_7293/g.24238  ORF Transcript_7293/g.24238 Transcript_7293/m.24238 type:complete len:315 (-) Transcript_7293:327-1271(-)
MPPGVPSPSRSGARRPRASATDDCGNGARGENGRYFVLSRCITKKPLSSSFAPVRDAEGAHAAHERGFDGERRCAQLQRERAGGNGRGELEVEPRALARHGQCKAPCKDDAASNGCARIRERGGSLRRLFPSLGRVRFCIVVHHDAQRPQERVGPRVGAGGGGSGDGGCADAEPRERLRPGRKANLDVGAARERVLVCVREARSPGRERRLRESQRREQALLGRFHAREHVLLSRHSPNLERPQHQREVVIAAAAALISGGGHSERDPDDPGRARVLDRTNLNRGGGGLNGAPPDGPLFRAAGADRNLHSHRAL